MFCGHRSMTFALSLTPFVRDYALYGHAFVVCMYACIGLYTCVSFVCFYACQGHAHWWRRRRVYVCMYVGYTNWKTILFVTIRKLLPLALLLFYFSWYFYNCYLLVYYPACKHERFAVVAVMRWIWTLQNSKINTFIHLQI